MDNQGQNLVMGPGGDLVEFPVPIRPGYRGDEVGVSEFDADSEIEYETERRAQPTP